MQFRWWTEAEKESIRLIERPIVLKNVKFPINNIRHFSFKVRYTNSNVQSDFL